MVVYDARPLRLVGQVLLDLVVVVGIVVSVLLGRAVSKSISGLADVGAHVHQQGTAFQGQLGNAAKALAKIPLAGPAVSRPLKNASESAGSIAAAGTQQHDETLRLAHQVGIGIAVVLIVLLVVIWIRYRGGFIRHATATRRVDRTPGGTEVLALRALVHRDAAVKLGPDIVDRWRRHDDSTVLSLANLERHESGLGTKTGP